MKYNYNFILLSLSILFMSCAGADARRLPTIARLYTQDNQEIVIGQFSVRNANHKTESTAFRLNWRGGMEFVTIPFQYVSYAKVNKDGQTVIRFADGTEDIFSNLFIPTNHFSGWSEYGPWEINASLVNKIEFLADKDFAQQANIQIQAVRNDYLSGITTIIEKYTVAVYPVRAASDLEKYLLTKLHTLLVTSGNFKVLERERLEYSLIEQQFSLGQPCNDSMCLAEVGKLGGAQKTIGWTLNILEKGNFANVNLRLVDVETAKIESIGDAEARIYNETSKLGDLVEESLLDLLGKQQSNKSAKTSSIVSVLGAVNKPGSIPWKQKMTFMDAIALSGGFADYASQNRVRIVRVANGIKKEFQIRAKDIIDKSDLFQNIYLKSGDQIIVPGHSYLIR